MNSKLTCTKCAQRNEIATQQVKRFLGQAAVELGGSKNILGIFLECSNPLIFQNIVVCPISPEKKSPFGGICIRDISSSVVKLGL